MPKSKVYSYDEQTPELWAEFLDRWHKGEKVEIDESMFYYWLEVLPPAFQGRMVELVDGTKQYVSFGFVEGKDRITAFWVETQTGKTRFLCQQTKLFS